MQYLAAESERHYQELRRKGTAVGWRGRDFEQFLLRPFLDYALSRLTFFARQPRALEYGTGTGPGACFLAARGFTVDGIDVCPTAIELAQQFAAQRRLRIQFAVQAIESLSCRDREYDLIVDNYCLHFHVTHEARRRVFEVVRSLLVAGGYYLIGTVVYREGRDYQERLRDPQTGIVYRRAADGEAAIPGEITQNGHRYVPNRRHATREYLRAEVEQAGFQVLFQEGGHLLCTGKPGGERSLERREQGR